MAVVTDEQVAFYRKNGYVCVEHFLTSKEVSALKQDIKDVIDSTTAPETAKPHVKMMGTKCHLDSVATIERFWEKECVAADGQLIQAPQHAIHKIAHAVHVLCPGARAVTFSDKMCDAVRRLTGYKRPTLVQGMFLLKQPRYGEASPVHVDETYVMSEPQGYVTGVWIALDDSSEHNGCLQFLPASHKTHRLTKRWVRKRLQGHEEGQDENESVMKFVDEDPGNTAGQRMADEDFVKVEAKSGTLIMIHGLVLHKSDPNTSSDPRAAYTFHFYEHDDARKIRWSPLNWAQELPHYQFPTLYSDA